jgi:PAS domain S-box-containing protein
MTTKRLSRSPSGPALGSGAAPARRHFETFLAELSTEFVGAPSDEVDQRVELWLRKLAEFVRVDRTSLWELPLAGASRGASCHYLYAAPGFALPQALDADHRYDWLNEQYRQGHVVAWSRIPEDVPAVALAELAHAQRTGVKSVLGIPLVADAKIWVLTLAAVHRYCHWTAGIVQRLKVVGEIFTNAILRHRAESLRQASEERFRGAFDHSGTGIALVSLTGRCIDANASLARMLGYSVNELCEMSIEDVTYPDDLQASVDYRARVLEGRAGHIELEKRYLRKDGSVVSGWLTSSLVRDSANRPLYFVSQVQDLTERMRARNEIEHLQRELAHAGRVSLMGHLSATLAHELLQPVTAILANAEAAQRLLEVGTSVDSKGQMDSYLTDVIECSHRAGEVIGRVRSMLRNERKPWQRLNLNKLVHEVVSVMRGDLVARRVKLVLQLDASLPEISGNAVEVQQVILNLLWNGCEAMMLTPVEARELTVSTAIRGRSIELMVKDHGTGVDPALLERMFEPFFSTKSDGMGMGLAICSAIVRAHGGRMWARNNAGVGLSVGCCVPAVDAAASAGGEKNVPKR